MTKYARLSSEIPESGGNPFFEHSDARTEANDCGISHTPLPRSCSTFHDLLHPGQPRLALGDYIRGGRNVVLAIAFLLRAEADERLSPIAAAEPLILHVLVRALDAELLTGGAADIRHGASPSSAACRG
ncbi:MAG: hypothetical protein WBO46_25240, partial [Caldilineaceae bacterium]